MLPSRYDIATATVRSTVDVPQAGTHAMAAKAAALRRWTSIDRGNLLRLHESMAQKAPALFFEKLLPSIAQADTRDLQKICPLLLRG